VRQQSPLWDQIICDPGSYRVSESLYRAIPETELDKWFLRTKSARAVPGRLLHTVELLEEVIANYGGGGGGNISVLNLGSGPGRDVLTVMSRVRANIRATMLDASPEALAEGRTLSTEMGLDGQAEFQQCNFLSYTDKTGFDIGVMVGIICPREADEARIMLKRVGKQIRRGGTLIVSNTHPRMAREEPLVRFMMEYLAEWVLAYKEDEELGAVMRAAGYDVIRIDREPLGYHLLGLGTKA